MRLGPPSTKTMSSSTQKQTRDDRRWVSWCSQFATGAWRRGVEWTRSQAAEIHKCSQCGKRVSLLANVCPQCGGASPARISPLACAALLAAGALVITVVLWLI